MKATGGKQRSGGDLLGLGYRRELMGEEAGPSAREDSRAADRETGVWLSVY